MQPLATVLLTDAHESVPEPFVARTCPDVPSEPGNVYVVNPATAGAWSVITPEVAPFNPTVVNVPAFGVVAPTVPLILIDAVPVRLVTVPLDGVPRAPPLTVNAPALPTLFCRALRTPLPGEIVPGAEPAPPPTTIPLYGNVSLDAQSDPLVK